METVDFLDKNYEEQKSKKIFQFFENSPQLIAQNSQSSVMNLLLNIQSSIPKEKPHEKKQHLSIVHEEEKYLLESQCYLTSLYRFCTTSLPIYEENEALESEKHEKECFNPSQNCEENYVKDAQIYLTKLYRFCFTTIPIYEENEEKKKVVPSKNTNKKSIANEKNKAQNIEATYGEVLKPKEKATVTNHQNANPPPKRTFVRNVEKKSVSPPKKPVVSRPTPIDPKKELKTIKDEKEKINEKIKEIETKLSSKETNIAGSSVVKTPKKNTVFKRSVSPLKPKEEDGVLKRLQEKKMEYETKKAQKLEEKEQVVKAELEKLNSEKEKIVEVFKLEKEKLFWRKMNELEERKAERLHKEMEYKSLVQNMIKNNKYPSIRTPELDKRKQEIALKRKLYSEYSMKIEPPPVEKKDREKTPIKPVKQNGRSVTPNQIKPNYLLVNLFNFSVLSIFLKELRQKNQEQREKIAARTNGAKEKKEWEKCLNDSKLTKHEKFNSVLSKAQILENQAKMKEKVVNISSRGIDIEMENEINELYVDSIKAKIALLERLKD